MAGAQAFGRVAVKILVKQDEIFPGTAFPVEGLVAVAGAAAVGVESEDLGQARRDFPG